MGQPDVEHSPRRLNEQVGNAVIPAHYAAAMNSVTEARDRAQRAYVIASAIAAGLVTAGAFAQIGDRPALVRVGGLAALGSWLLAASLFMHTVGATSAPRGKREFSDEDEFVASLLEDNRTAREAVNVRHRRARVATYGAITLTVAALALGLFLPASEEAQGTLSLTDAGAASVERICGSRIDMLEGKLSVASLDAELIEVDPTSCKSVGRLKIPRSDVLLIELAG